MNCPKCNAQNDNDAVFCSSCGEPVLEKPAAASPSRKPYFYALLFIPIVVLAAGFGYYKYVLPSGVAAVVNGEEIKIAELDATLARIQPGTDAAQQTEQARRLRHDVLNQLITERLAFQAARKNGVDVSEKDIQAVVERSRQSSGMDQDAFQAAVAKAYGNASRYEDAIRRGLVIDKYFSEIIVPPGTPLRERNDLLDAWVRSLREKGAVRITLAEQWSGGKAGCACCNKKAPAGGGQDQVKSSPAADEATAAALRYWREKHGPQQVTAKAKDFGCHFEVDIFQDSKRVGSLRYQQGSITEL